MFGALEDKNFYIMRTQNGSKLKLNGFLFTPLT